MKRNFWLLSVVCLGLTLSFFSPQVFADNTSSIFKIQAYSYNTSANTYELEQYGSAVLVADDLLLTNAHVVSDMDDKFTLQYEACQTISSSEKPNCFSTLQLLSYDLDEDLALLKIINPSTNMPSPVVLGTGTLSVGAAISVIGYPANGGKSVTTTQGTIAGYEEGYYKTDANLDGGNSGGGGFDGQGNLIGVPTFVIGGQTTMGYLIPISTVKEFIAGDIGTTSTHRVSAVFTKRIEDQRVLMSQEFINNNIFATTGLSAYGLEITDVREKKLNNLYSYVFENENTSQVRIDSFIATDDATIQKYINNEMKQFREAEMTVQKINKKIGTTAFQVVVGMDEEVVVYEYIQTHSTNKTYLEFVIIIDGGDVEEDLSDLTAFVENTVIKRSSTKPQVLNMPGIKLSSKWGIGIMKYLIDGELSISLFPKSGNYVVDFGSYAAEKGDTVKKIMNQMQAGMTMFGIDWETETSKYPTKVLFMRITDEDNKTSLFSIGTVKSGTTTYFIQFEISLRSASNKKEAMIMVYKILGLE